MPLTSHDFDSMDGVRKMQRLTESVVRILILTGQVGGRVSSRITVLRYIYSVGVQIR